MSNRLSIITGLQISLHVALEDLRAAADAFARNAALAEVIAYKAQLRAAGAVA